MRFARVLTVCAALISTFLGAETVHSRSPRRSQLKLVQKELPQPKLENGTTKVSDMAFATLQQEAATTNQKSHSNIKLEAGKRHLKLRSSRSMPLRRNSNRMNANRRRRQLHLAAKTSHVGRSYELSDNHVGTKQIETIQPAEAFDNGVIHLEPIYRVSKQKNIFDSIIDILRKLVNPPKAVGPLVGPFNLPGVGDKVYIRLLEPVKPDHLVIRLVSHLPASEIESVFDKDDLGTSEGIEGHAVVPSVSHEALAVSNDELTNSYSYSDVHLTPSDALLSSSNNMVTVSKPNNSGQNIGNVNRTPKVVESSRTPRSKFKDDLNGYQRIIRHRKKHPPLVAAKNNNYVTSVPEFKSPEQVNRTRYGRPPQGSSFHEFFEPVYSSINGSAEENLGPVNLHQVHVQSNPISASTQKHVVYTSPATPFANSLTHEAFATSPILPGFQIPARPQYHSGSNYNRTAQEGSKYSIEFSSKNMRYLNMDGSVEPAIKEKVREKYEPSVELGPIFSKAPTVTDNRWEPIQRMDVESKEASKGVQSNGGNEGFMKAQRKSDVGDRRNYSQSRQTSNSATRSEQQSSKEEENRSTKSRENKSAVNNSASSVKSASNSGSTSSPVQ